MSHIQYQTDQWGGKGMDHMEVRLGDTVVFITISDGMSTIASASELHVQKPAINVVEITTARPRG